MIRLIHPAYGVQVLPDDMVQFEWDLPDVHAQGPVRLSLYVGEDSASPAHDPNGAKKRWLLPPADLWTRFNETPRNLGLAEGRTFYWQVTLDVPGSATMVSEIRQIVVVAGDAPALGVLRFEVECPAMIMSGIPVTIHCRILNLGDKPVQAPFPRGNRFTVSIRKRTWAGGERLVWSVPDPRLPSHGLETVTIRAHETLGTDVVWIQRDFRGTNVPPGAYSVEVTANLMGATQRRTRTFRILD